MCVCVCVCEREKWKEGGNLSVRESYTDTLQYVVYNSVRVTETERGPGLSVYSIIIMLFMV